MLNGKHHIIYSLFFVNFFPQKLEKYEYVGRLLRPGEEPNSYSDEEDESSESTAAKANKSEENIKNLNSSSTTTATTTATATDKPKDEWPVHQANDDSNQNYENNQYTSKSHAHP